MIIQPKELFAPSLHYQEAIDAEVHRANRTPLAGPPMLQVVSDHLEAMLAQAAKETQLKQCNLLLQYCSGFVGHAVMSQACTIEERVHYWNRIEQIRQALADQQRARNGK